MNKLAAVPIGIFGVFLGLFVVMPSDYLVYAGCMVPPIAYVIVSKKARKKEEQS